MWFGKVVNYSDETEPEDNQSGLSESEKEDLDIIEIEELTEDDEDWLDYLRKATD